jgi:hypothetical protein
MGIGQWKTVDLTGVKNGINVTYTIPDVPDLETLLVIINTSALRWVASAPTIMQFTISGTTITLGLAPNSADRVWAQYDVA